MRKLIDSKKRFLLEVFAVLVVCAFLATSLSPSIGHFETNVHSNPLVSNNNNSSNAGYVKYTLVLSNNTLINGNFINTGNRINPVAVAFDSSNGYVYVANVYSEVNGHSGSISVINGATDDVIDNITVGSDPVAVAFDSSNGFIYVTNSNSNTVSVINGATNAVIDTIAVGLYPIGVAFDSSNGYVYVADTASNNVSVINGATNAVIDTIQVGSDPHGISFDSSSGYVYVANYCSNNVSVINGATNAVIDTIADRWGPYEVSFDSSNGYVYAANFNSNNVSVINGATNAVIDTIGVGSYPDAISFDSSNGYVYVANLLSGTISIIATTTEAAEYPVTFTESGLSSGTTWYVNISNGMDSGAITGTSYSFSLTNGTYSYTVGHVNGYTSSPSSGSVTVSGESVEKAITFSPSNVYNMSFGVLYKNYPYTINLTVNPAGLENAISVNSLPEKFSLKNVSTYLYDFLTAPNSYDIYSVEIFNSKGSQVTDVSTAESILYQTFIWAMLYNNAPLLQSTYGINSSSYSDLTGLQETQWVQEAGIYASDFVNYATLIGPILGGISSYFSSNSADVKLVDMATHAIFDLMKGYESLESNYGQQEAGSILATLAQEGLISSSNPSSYSPSILITNLAQLNPNEMNSLVFSIYSDLGVQSSQVPGGVVNLVTKTLENLGENALSIGISAASSSAVTFIQSYFAAGTIESASSDATQAAVGSIEGSASDFLAFMLPLSIASAIYSSYLEPMSSDLEQLVNTQDLMNNTLYPVMFSTLGSYSEGNYANISDAAASMFTIGLIQSEWYSWFNASIAELKGEFLNFNAGQEIQMGDQIESSLFDNLRVIYFGLHNASLMADSLVNGQEPNVKVSQNIDFSVIMTTLPIDVNQIELEMSQGWQQFTSAISSAAKYAQNAWSNLTSGINSLSNSFSNFIFGSDPPEFTVTMDNFTAEQEAGVLISTYPMSSIIYGNNSATLILPGNLSGYLSTEVNESVEVKAIYYNESSPQTTRILTSLNAEAGNAYVMYINSTSTGKKAVIAGYSLSFSESNYGNIPWKVELVSSNGSIRSVIESNDSVIVFNDLPDGSYNFSVISLNATYRTSPKNGTITVNGSNVSERIIFFKVEYTYEVTFTESGLPSGTMWYVNLTESNGTIYRSGGTTGTSITFSSLVNETYSYTIATSDHTYKPSASSGSLTVNGKNQTISVAFTEVKYTVTFTESGLQSGTIWYVNITEGNGPVYYSGPISGSSYSFSLTNGTYSYSIGAVSGYSVSPSFGNVNVSGNNVPVAITFTPVKTIVSNYTITFTEAGLPSGTSWSVTLNGISESSTTNTITFTMPNGTYSYAIGSISGYTVSTSSGSMTVNGSNMSQTITFTPVKITVMKYTVTFTESGLPSGTEWYVNITASNGTTYDSGPITNSSYSLQLSNGTYSYTISSISGYNITQRSGSIGVSGRNTSQSITFSKVSTTPPSKKPTSPTTPNTDLYIIIGAVAAVAVIGAVVVIMMRKKK